MKRDAESQLTKGEIAEGYTELEQTPDTGFKKAPDEILKARVIRGLPNRTKPFSVQSNSTNGTTVSPLFPSSISSPGSTFTFTSPAAATNSFTSLVTQSSDSINSWSSSPFGKFVAQTNPFGFASQTSSPSVTADEDDCLFQYYINLRGLNHSLLNAISKGIEGDPFADMSGIVESYKSTRLKIQKEKDDMVSSVGGNLAPETTAANLTGKEGLQSEVFVSGITPSQSKTVISADENATEEKAADDVTDGEGEQTSGGVSNLLAVHNPHDDEGEGEENETTVHAIKVKAYRMRKVDAKSGPGWADLGFGILRLKKDNDTSARRMLLRNSTNGKILINFKIYSGLKPSLAKKALTFVGHDNGVSQAYCVRLPGEEQAQQLKDALDREIDSVTAKDEK